MTPASPVLRATLLALLLPASWTVTAQQAETSTTEPGIPAAAETLPAAEPPPAIAPVVGAATQGDPVLRAQVLLERSHFSPGEIDGGAGGNTRRAIAGFQASRNLPATGELDDATWAALDADAAPALVQYVVTAADVAGPFVALPADMMARSKLDALGYTSAAEALGEKFHASPRLLAKLNPGVDLASVGASITVPNVLDIAPLPKAARLVVDRSDATVSLLDAAGTVLAQFPASTGSRHDPLPVGEWKINGVARNPVFQYNPKLFWDANPAHGKATIPPGPNNPVGTTWIDLSKEHYGIHGTPEPSKIGKTESHGCIRMTNWSAAIAAAAVGPGTPALLQE